MGAPKHYDFPGNFHLKANKLAIFELNFNSYHEHPKLFFHCVISLITMGLLNNNHETI